MGHLVEQQIKSFFQGVSSQPDSFRTPGQVADSLNVQYSVERGGFSKRYPSKHVKTIEGVSGPITFHTIDRDPTEQYLVTMKGGTVRVFTPAGEEKTVTVTGDADSYLSANEDDMTMISVADYTFILNREKIVEMDEAVAPPPDNKAVIFVYYGVAGSYKVKVNDTEVSATGSTNTETLSNSIVTALVGGLLPAEDWKITREGSYIFVERTDGADFTISTSDSYSDKGMRLTFKKAVTSADLPLKAPEGLVVRVGAESVGEYYVKSERLNEGSADVRWLETVAPGGKIKFKPTTMPQALVRTEDGTFDLKSIDWNEKKAGTDETAPPPEFVGKKIRDIVFHRNRLAVLSDETAYFSSAGDYFNFFPTKTTEVLDDAPFGLTASTNKVAILEWAAPFRKALFTTADNAQFEVSGELLTSKKSTIDLATTYSVTNRCRPVVVGDSLYFAAANGRETVVFEYLYDDSTVSNTAIDSTKHVKGYIPSTVEHMTADPVTGNLFIVSSGDQSAVYTYTFFWNGDEKAQQAWGRWDFNGHKVRGVSFMGSHLYVVVERPEGLSIERVSFGDEGYGNYNFVPNLDRNVEITGVFDDGRTTWTLPYDVQSNLVGVSSNLFETADRNMAPIQLTFDGPRQVSARGDWSAHPCIFGFTYNSFVKLSKIYYREGDGSAVITGRLQVRYLTFLYERTGYFKVIVTPETRDQRTHQFTGRIIGSIYNRPSYTPITSGAFRFPVWSRGDTVDIRVESDNYLPFTITSAAWTGFYNEIVRQEG